MIQVDAINNIQNIVKGMCMVDEPLCKHTTFNIGGNVALWIEPADKEDLKNVLKEIQENGLTWRLIGNGSNILAGEYNLPDVVIKLINFKSIDIDGSLIHAGSGISLAKLIGFAIEYGLSGLEFAAGIPGFVGGAIKGNAGAHGRNIGDILKEIEVMNSDGEISIISRNEINFDYRKSDINDNLIVLGGTFNLVQGDKNKIQELVKGYLVKRKENYPSEPNAGSVFKNPSGAKAGEIIDKLGLKGFRIGNAMVSYQHANMIVNVGGAKAQDVRELIKYIQDKVNEKTGINLDPEIIFLGE
jgi:UDP-N-acetylmuramate dehydrogenase